MKVSIIIPALNEAAHLAETLPALRRQAGGFEVEVIVVDSGSTDDTRAVAEKNGAQVLAWDAPFNHGAVRNWGAEHARGEYLVTLSADALPADERWLEELLRPLLADERLAGTYSRQIPREGCHPLEAARIAAHLPAAHDGKVVRKQALTWEAFDALTPGERAELIAFDDVSAARPRWAWTRFPLADVPWAEDREWAARVLTGGYAIAYVPASCVIHSHRRRLTHTFRRAYQDHWALRRFAGYRPWVSACEAWASARAHGRVNRDTLKAWAVAAPGRRWRALRYRAAAPFDVAAETAGAWLAGIEPRERSVAFDFVRQVGRARRRIGSPRQVLRTVFTLGGERRRTLFANPPTALDFRVAVPAGARLTFAVGLDPQASARRRARHAGPIVCRVAVNGVPQWEARLTGAPDSRWVHGVVDRSPYAGRRAAVTFVTLAADTDDAWAGWGEPVVWRDRRTEWERLRTGVLHRIENRLMGTVARHP